MRFLKNILIILGIIFLFLFNNLLGYLLGFWGSCHQTTISGGVHLYTSCTGITRHLISNSLVAIAITVGDNVLTTQENLSPVILSHELAHVKQYRIFGPAFLPMYACAHLAAWIDTKMYSNHTLHDSNFFEYMANNMAEIKR
jgi:hypothetical protein